jgi:hypothetical protein
MFLVGEITSFHDFSHCFLFLVEVIVIVITLCTRSNLLWPQAPIAFCPPRNGGLLTPIGASILLRFLGSDATLLRS